jgi:flagellar assembly protein FliH
MSSLPDGVHRDGGSRSRTKTDIPLGRGVVLGGADDKARGAVPFQAGTVAGDGSADGYLEREIKQARSAGYTAGWAHGLREARDTARSSRERINEESRRVAAQRKVSLERATHAVLTAAAALELRNGPAVVALEDAVVDAAIELAQALLGRELSTVDAPGRDALARVLALVPAGSVVRVRMCPMDHAALVAADGDERVLDGRTVTLVADPALEPGDAVADHELATVDARLSTAVARLRRELGATVVPGDPAGQIDSDGRAGG